MMTQDEVLFQKHLSDLAGTADRRGFAVFTDFMNLNELNIFHASAQKFSYVTTKLLAGMNMQSVRWQHLSLMLFFFNGAFPLPVCESVR